MLHQTKESFDIKEDFDFAEFLRPSFGVYQGKPVKVRIWFSPDAAGYIKEKSGTIPRRSSPRRMGPSSSKPRWLEQKRLRSGS